MEIKENSAIFIDSPEMSKKIQERLFELDYTWVAGKVVDTKSFEVLTIYPGTKRIHYCEKKWISSTVRFKIITPLDLGILPDKWYIIRNKDNYNEVNDYFNDKFGTTKYICSIGSLNNNGSANDDNNEYTELTTEQFKTLVLKEPTVENSTEEYYYRFKTEQEFKKDNLWGSTCPRSWSNIMLHLLGKIIDRKYYVNCINKESFCYKDNAHTWMISSNNYVKEYNIPDIKYYQPIILKSINPLELNLQTNKTNNNGTTIKVSGLPTIISRRERERGIIICSKYKETTIRNGYFRNKKSY